MRAIYWWGWILFPFLMLLGEAIPFALKLARGKLTDGESWRWRRLKTEMLGQSHKMGQHYDRMDLAVDDVGKGEPLWHVWKNIIVEWNRLDPNLGAKTMLSIAGFWQLLAIGGWIL